MSKITKERFEDLKRMLWETGSQRECPVWSGAAARTIETGNIVAPMRFWSPRAGGVFTVPAGVPDRRLQIPDDEVRNFFITFAIACSSFFFLGTIQFQPIR